MGIMIRAPSKQLIHPIDLEESDTSTTKSTTQAQHQY